MKALRLLCAVACLICSAGDARAALITTFPAWNGSDAGGPFGYPTISTVGQTFTVTGPETLLNNYSVWLNDNGAPLSFKTYLMYWNNTLNRPFGPLVYEAAGVTSNTAGFEKITFNTGNLPLISGQTYVLFESVSEAPFYIPTNGSAQVGAVPTNPYPGGTSVALNDLGNPALWTTSSWNVNALADGVFEATVSLQNVPEPSSLALIGTVAVCFVARRRRLV